MATKQPGSSAPGQRKNKRGSWSLNPENHDMVLEDMKRLCLSSANAALNVDLAELRDWRLGVRRFVETRTPPPLRA